MKSVHCSQLVELDNNEVLNFNIRNKRRAGFEALARCGWTLSDDRHNAVH
jgi:hypothetical protein